MAMIEQGRGVLRVNGAVTQNWVYKDGLAPVAETDGGTNIVGFFVYGTSPFSPDYMVRDGVIYRLIRDFVGSVRLVVNAATGDIAQRLDYDSFGKVLVDTNPGFQPFGFKSGLYDPDTGLVHFGARWYDPETGRWISKDPILLEGGLNLYVFCGNDPVNFADPWGLCESLRMPNGTRIPYPPGVNIYVNMNTASDHWNPSWFYNQVRNNGPWDYKQQGSQYQDFGNFNYGATGAAFGFPENVLLREAGRAQQAAGTSRLEWGNPGWRLNPFGGSGSYGDDPRDAELIRQGIQFYQNYEQQRNNLVYSDAELYFILLL